MSFVRKYKYIGFTLIELLVVLAIIATLLTLVSPRYFTSLDHSHEVALKHDLSVMREAISHFKSDLDRYPQNLDELVERRYIKKVPIDPITGSSETWLTIAPPNPVDTGMYDIISGAEGVASDGTAYSDW